MVEHKVYAVSSGSVKFSDSKGWFSVLFKNHCAQVKYYLADAED